MIGEKISPILIEIENVIWSFEANNPGIPCGFSREDFRASLKIFMTIIMEQMFAMQTADDMPQGQREEMALKCGEELKKLVHTFTGIDTLELYKEKFSGSFSSN